MSYMLCLYTESRFVQLPSLTPHVFPHAYHATSFEAGVYPAVQNMVCLKILIFSVGHIIHKLGCFSLPGQIAGGNIHQMNLMNIPQQTVFTFYVLSQLRFKGNMIFLGFQTFHQPKPKVHNCLPIGLLGKRKLRRTGTSEGQKLNCGKCGGFQWNVIKC